MEFQGPEAIIDSEISHKRVTKELISPVQRSMDSSYIASEKLCVLFSEKVVAKWLPAHSIV